MNWLILGVEFATQVLQVKLLPSAAKAAAVGKRKAMLMGFSQQFRGGR
jgi:hypothetical protein